MILNSGMMFTFHAAHTYAFRLLMMLRGQGPVLTPSTCRGEDGGWQSIPLPLLPARCDGEHAGIPPCSPGRKTFVSHLCKLFAFRNVWLLSSLLNSYYIPTNARERQPFSGFWIRIKWHSNCERLEVGWLEERKGKGYILRASCSTFGIQFLNTAPI